MKITCVMGLEYGLLGEWQVVAPFSSPALAEAECKRLNDRTERGLFNHPKYQRFKTTEGIPLDVLIRPDQVDYKP